MRRSNYLKNKFVQAYNFLIYKKGTKNVHWEKLISSIIVGVLFGILVFNGRKRQRVRDDERDNNARYTIGTITGRFNNIRGASTVSYEYIVNGRKYEQKADWRKFWDFPPLGKRYYVKFQHGEAWNSELLFEYQVLDSLFLPPISGWRTLPEALLK